MATNENISILPQLKEGTNFANWKFRLKLVFEEKGVNQVLVDEITDANKTKDVKARSIIVQCLSDQYLEYVKNAKTANEMIKCLENVFERKSTFNKLYLRKQLLNLKCKNTDRLQDHFLKFDTLINQIESTGSKMEESDKVCHILLTMPECYNNIVTTIETMSVDKDITLDFVKSCLLDAEIKQENKGSFNSKIDEAVFSAPNKQIECFKCHKKGHIASECRSRNPSFHCNGRGYRKNSNSYRGNGHGYQLNNVNSDRLKNNKLNTQQSHLTKNLDNFNFVALNDDQVMYNNSEINHCNTIDFIIDSGATENLVKQKFENVMHNIETLENPVNIKIANGEILKAHKKGVLKVNFENKVVNVEALVVPQLFHNIISVKKLTKNNFKVVFEKASVKIIYSNNQTLFYCNLKNGLYTMQGRIFEEAHTNVCNQNNIWHQRLGHLNRKGLKIMNLPVSDEICEPCMKCKLTRLPFKHRKGPRSSKIGELIHSDISGPVTPNSMGGHKYFQTITDDYSHFVKIYLLKEKSDAEENLKNYIRETNVQKGVKIARIRCDNGGEYSSNYFKQFCQKKGIQVEYTRPYSPQQNGVSERMNRTLYNKARTMLSETKLPKYLWSEAIMCAAYQLNRCPSAAINNRIPAEVWYGKLDLNKLRVFGSKAWAVVIPRNSKLYERGLETRMVGYSLNGYRLWNQNRNEVIISRDVRFDESQIEYKNDDEQNKNDEKCIRVNLKKNDNGVTEEDIEKNKGETAEDHRNSSENTSRSRRNVQKPLHLNDYELYSAFCLVAENDPKTYNEAMNNGEEWQKAIKKELDSHEKMNTWTVTTLPKGKKAIDAKWIFKTKEDGTKKARLVARGFQEENSLTNNYSPVARLTTIRLLLAHSVEKDWIVKQLDVPTAFLNSKINCEVYMKIPPGLIENQNKVLKMNRGLYGLKESPRCWNERFTEFAKENGLKRSLNDFCLYIGTDVWLVLFVDDILITGKEEEVMKIISQLKKEFEAKDLGEVNKFLGMEIERNENEMKITQKRQIDKMLEKFNMKDCNGTHIPMSKGFLLSKNEEEINVPYRELIGSLMFISTVSRPDITYATSYLSQFLDHPTTSAWKEAKRALRYLKSTKNLGLVYKKSDNTLIETFSDADWASCQLDRKSVSGSVSMFRGKTISWFSRKQVCVSLSSAEAEYVAAATSVTEMVNIQRICEDLNEKITSVLYVDNKGAIDMTQSFENSKRTKHIDTRYHFIKDAVLSGKVTIQYVESKKNIADMFTKSLPRESFEQFRENLSVM